MTVVRLQIFLFFSIRGYSKNASLAKWHFLKPPPPCHTLSPFSPYLSAWDHFFDFWSLLRSHLASPLSMSLFATYFINFIPPFPGWRTFWMSSNPFYVTGLFLYTLKTWENLTDFLMFWGDRKETSGIKWVNSEISVFLVKGVSVEVLCYKH